MSAHIHILGVCGTFMGGLAALARAAGYRVTGCDANVYPPMSDQLAALGIELIEGYDADQIRLAPDVWVVGNVIKRGNPLMEAILERGARFASGPEWLADEILFGKWVLAVAGTHGKTTTSAMLAWILEHAGKAPGFLIGGVPVNFGVSARSGEGPYFVIEADEYDTAFFDKRSKFVHYRARTAILNNLEFDHADIFGEIGDIERQFHHFVRILPGSGRLVSNAADAALERVLALGCWTPLERFGTPDGWSAQTVALDDSAFDVQWRGATLGRVHWTLGGAHNRMNALAAVAAARHAGVGPRLACEALGRFAGVRRRMELRGSVRDIAVYDDFAHHPTAIRATLAGLRARCDGARILAVLEPRSNTMKAGVMKDALPGSLEAADLVFVHAAGLAWDAAAVFAPLGARVQCHDDLATLTDAIVRAARPGDQLLLMSNGSFGGLHARLLERLVQGGGDADQGQAPSGR
ncbi:MAG TPA: UDP-N-acetylmuramate:L-alanyl-gamma-D-glutamyl-meso-diaminopimelate ligase [Burkholderiales bacterium]|nr:UDP-N-acetylmuramate:L-alanyl-gamma-D-glutamyl-meso-diaminopimelate ligase [Burkholderiales bacterium]